MVSLTVNIPHSFLNGLKVIIAPTEEAVLKLRVRVKTKGHPCGDSPYFPPY